MQGIHGAAIVFLFISSEALAMISAPSDAQACNPLLGVVSVDPSVLPVLAISPRPSGVSSTVSADGESPGLPLRSRESLVRLQTDEIKHKHLHIFFGAIRTESWPILVLPSARVLL